MLLRAIFWMAVVALLMPHVTAPARCEAGQHCSYAFVLLDRIRTSGLHRLEQVRADIESDEEARARRF
jgi:hypothetical protein